MISLNIQLANKNTQHYFFYLLIGLLVMVGSPALTAEETPLEAKIDVKNIAGNIHIKPSIQWLIDIDKQEAEQFTYHLSVKKSGSSGSNNSNQRGKIPLVPINQFVVLSTTQMNFLPDAKYEFTLKIYKNEEIVTSVEDHL